MSAARQPRNDAFLSDCARIHEAWHARAKGSPSSKDKRASNSGFG